MNTTHELAVAQLAALNAWGENRASVGVPPSKGELALGQLVLHQGTDAWGALQDVQEYEAPSQLPLEWPAWCRDNAEQIERRHGLVQRFAPFAAEVADIRAGRRVQDMAPGNNSRVVALETTMDGRQFVAKFPLHGSNISKRTATDKYVRNLSLVNVPRFERLWAVSYAALAGVSVRRPGKWLEELQEAEIEATPKQDIAHAAEDLRAASARKVQIDNRGAGNILHDPADGYSFIDYWTHERPRENLAVANFTTFAQALLYAGRLRSQNGYSAEQLQRRAPLLQQLYHEAQRLYPNEPQVASGVHAYSLLAGYEHER